MVNGSSLHIRRSKWRHPAIRTSRQPTLGERASDRLRNGMGSWGFILLNLVLSCLAAMQGAILLIAARREDQINSEVAQHDYEINAETLELVREICDLSHDLHRSGGPSE